jgi:predicted RNase H-like nuclease (RuvC/YqgF family)
MNNLYKRPMFRKGGSAEGGITSGLQRPGYSVGKRVTEVMDEMQSIRPQRNTAKRRLGDLMIDFGIDIASRTPMGDGIGGAISTALASAKDPFAKFKQSRAADEGYEDKLALGAYDVVKGEQAAQTKFDREKELIALEAKLNPKNKKGFEFASKQDALSKLQDGQDVITQQITEIQTMPASPEVDVSANQEQIKQLQRELQKNQQLQKLITGEDDMIGETILKSIAADTGDFDLND